MSKVLGILMLVILFAGIFVTMGYVYGPKEVAIALGIFVGIIIWVTVAAYLLVGR